MVEVKVKLQKRPSGKYESLVVTIPKIVIDSAPKFKSAKEVYLDVDKKGNIVVRAG